MIHTTSTKNSFGTFEAFNIKLSIHIFIFAQKNEEHINLHRDESNLVNSLHRDESFASIYSPRRC
jgi:hypothetical protein